MLSCTLEPGNVHSLNAIIVKKIKDADRKKIPDPLAPLLRNGMIAEVKTEVTGEPRDAPEGKWTLGSGIEIPCRYILYGRGGEG